jgi:hypothetical protein
MLVCSLTTLCFLSLTGWIIGRYTVDFAPLMILASCCTAVAVWQKHGRMSPARARLLRLFIQASVAWSVVLNVAIEAPTLQQLRHLLSKL